MKIFIVTFLLLVGANSIAQSVVYYPFNSVLGLSSNPSKPVWLDFKFQTNSYFSSLTTDISPEFNLKTTNRAKYYFGGGIKLNFLNAIEGNSLMEGYFLNTGVRITPFEKNKKFQVAFELSPYAGKKFDIGVFRSFLGIGYNFSR